jgi:hypothetical protein
MANIKSISGCFLGICFLLAGCKTAAPAAPVATPAHGQAAAPATPLPSQAAAMAEPVLKPGAAAAGALGMSLLIASPLKLVADLDALSKSLELPVSLGQSLLPTLTSAGGPGGIKVARETLDRLDVTRPLAVIWLARGSGVPAGWCVAIAFKEKAFAWEVLQTAGTGSGQNEGTFERHLPSGDLVWGAVKDRQLLISGSRETLLAAGSLAIAAQTTPMTGQALFTLSPSVMARSTGQPLDVLLAGVLGLAVAEMEKDASKTGKPLTPASKKMTEALLKTLIRPLSEIAMARVSLEIGAGRGVVVRAEAQPTPGSQLATKAGHVSPYLFDLALPVRSDATMAVAWGDVAPWLPDWIQVVEASGPAGRAAGKDLGTLFGESINGGSCAVDLGVVPVVSMCSLAVRPGVDAARALDRYLAFLQSSNAWDAEVDGHKPKPLKVKRAGKVVEIEKAIEARDPQVMAVMKSILGGDVARSALTVKDGRVVLAVGAKPRELLDRYGRQQAPMKTAAPIVARTLLDTASANGVGLGDVMAILSKVAANSKELAGQPLVGMMAAVPGLADMHAPVVLTSRGGAVPAIEFQVPFATLQNVARVVSAFMGQMGAMPGQ